MNKSIIKKVIGFIILAICFTILFLGITISTGFIKALIILSVAIIFGIFLWLGLWLISKE